MSTGQDNYADLNSSKEHTRDLEAHTPPNEMATNNVLVQNQDLDKATEESNEPSQMSPDRKFKTKNNQVWKPVITTMKEADRSEEAP